jgi:hypothetical protein
MYRFIKIGGNKKRTKEKGEDKREGQVDERKKPRRCGETQSRICRLYFPYRYREDSNPVKFVDTFCTSSLKSSYKTMAFLLNAL